VISLTAKGAESLNLDIIAKSGDLARCFAAFGQDFRLQIKVTFSISTAQDLKCDDEVLRPSFKDVN
jgi:hypothetical protein